MKIKYRAWDIEAKRMISFDEIQKAEWPVTFECPGYVFMLFTGLIDKNGIEVYAGDRLNIEFGRNHLQDRKYLHDGMTVSWDEKELCWAVNDEKNYHRLGGYFLPSYEVVGHKYLNS